MMNTMIETIVKELGNKGYKAKIEEITKNSFKSKVLVIGEDRCRPVFYVESMLSDGLSPSDIVTCIIEAIKNTPKLHFDARKVTSWDYAKENLILCLQKKSDEDILKTNFLDMEVYVRVKISDEGTFKVTNNMFPVSKEEILKRAIEQSLKETEIKWLSDMMKEQGVPVEPTHDKNDQLILTTKSKHYGASVILNEHLLKGIAERFNSNLVIFPSSIHECIIMFDDNPDMYFCNNMVRETNETQVSPEDRLVDHAYFFDRRIGKLQ